MWATFAIVAASIVAYATERWRMELVGAATLCALLILFAVEPGGMKLPASDLLAGFANPALVTVLALLVVGQALFQTDALEAPAKMLSGIGGKRPMLTLAIVLFAVAIVSAFLNNTPVVVMLIPILAAIAHQRSFAPASGMMPLSFAAILGGMTTLIGSSTNLLVAGVANRSGIEMTFFEVTPLGVPIALVGMVYVAFILPRLLRQREGMVDAIGLDHGRQFVSQIDITPDHAMVGARPIAGMFKELPDITVRTVLRSETPMLPPFDGLTLQPGDTLIVAATRKALMKALASGSGAQITSSDEGPGSRSELTVAEAVVAPGSRYAARTLRDAHIHEREGVHVLGLQRRSHMRREALDATWLEPGDTLLIGGSQTDVASLRASRDLLLLEWSAATVPLKKLAPRALLIFVIVVAAAALEFVPIVTAALCGAAAMIAAGCIPLQQVRRAFDTQIFVMVGSSLAAATALEATGGASYVAMGFVGLFYQSDPAIVLSAYFLIVAILTNIVSNNAAAVLFTPIALGIAATTGIDAHAFLIATVFAVNCSFATPVGYQTNLLVMGPGHYRFSDFIYGGTPLVIIVWLTYSVIAPWYFGL